MGQSNACCSLDKVEHRPSSAISAQVANMSEEEAANRCSQLSSELKRLKDENYRIREEQVALVKEMNAASRCSKPQVDMDQQLGYMREMVRKIEADNLKLRETASSAAPGQQSTEARYRQLRSNLVQLQQAHLEQLQEAQQLQGFSPSRRVLSASFTTSRPGDPLSLTDIVGASDVAAGADDLSSGIGNGNALKELEALSQEHEALRAKVRMLAREPG
mmetsp:Transcript_110101/g.200302  ORF Transcript_110101/g.200302 Transcript_110101/m.200302 type:complete len:218 (+) Transcript_110101:171-824(+)